MLLEALAAVERLGIDPDPIGPDAATLARILMAASSDRDRHLADPEAMTVHVSSLLDDGHIAALCDVVRAASTDTGRRPGVRRTSRATRSRSSPPTPTAGAFR